MAITGDTGANHIFPCVLTVPVAWNDMIQGKMSGFLTAILAGKVVAIENLKAGQLPLLPWALNHIGQSDYGGEGEGISG